MALTHLASGEAASLAPHGAALASSRSHTLIKSAALEVNRLVLRAGARLREHRVPGEITVQCLEGEVDFEAHGTTRRLRPGDLLYLTGGVPHALHAHRDASLLLTILLAPAAAPSRPVARDE